MLLYSGHSQVAVPRGSQGAVPRDPQWEVFGLNMGTCFPTTQL